MLRTLLGSLLPNIHSLIYGCTLPLHHIFSPSSGELHLQYLCGGTYRISVVFGTLLIYLQLLVTGCSTDCTRRLGFGLGLFTFACLLPVSIARLTLALWARHFLVFTCLTR
jgi:hypothetical protein